MLFYAYRLAFTRIIKSTSLIQMISFIGMLPQTKCMNDFYTVFFLPSIFCRRTNICCIENMKIDNIDNITNKEKSPDKAERANSIDDLKKTQKFFDFNDLSNSTATINTINKNLILPEKDPVFDYLSPGSSKLKKLLLNSDPEVANLNINNEKVHNNEYLNSNNDNNDNSGLSIDTLFSSNAITKTNNINNSSKLKLENNSVTVALNSNQKNGEKKSSVNFSKQKLFWCSECNEYFLRQNLFNHMKSVHNKFTCLYCYGLFVKIECLENHLVKKHKVQNTSFFDEHTLKNYFEVKEPDIVSKVIKAVCCKCSSTFVISDNNFHSHFCDRNEKFTPLKGAVQANAFKNDSSNLALYEDAKYVDNNTQSSVTNLLSASKDDDNDSYIEKESTEWIQTNLNGGIVKILLFLSFLE